MNTETSTSSGIGFCGLLAIVFITLKLCHVIDWSWWWVLSPLWVPAALTVAVLLLIALGCLISFFLKELKR